MAAATIQPLPREFSIRLTMLSDWHVGSGAGRPGQVDRLLVRDADDLPYVPAKSLRGIWRDACERLALGLDGGKVGPWCSFVDLLFGSQPALGKQDPTGRHSDPANAPLASALLVRPARIEGRLRHALLANRRLCAAITFVKPGVSIDPASGVAREDFLRFEEMGRVNTVLEARCVLHLPEGERLAQAAAAMLVAGMALIERLGGKRRRGAGRCCVRLVDPVITPQQAADWLEANPLPPEWPQHGLPLSSPHGDATQDARSQAVPNPNGDGWLDLDLCIELQGPLALSHRTVGNVVETLDFVPGTYLLPHVTRCFQSLGWDARPSIAQGDVRVLAATLEACNQRSRPVPLAWHAPKGGALGAPIVNRLHALENSAVQLKQMRDEYVTLVGTHAYVCKVPRLACTHNTIEDGPQRPTPEVGGVYTYEAIAPIDENRRPVRLRAVLRLRTAIARMLQQKQAGWWKTLEGRVCLGRSKKDDYGEVILSVAPPRECKAPAAGDVNLLSVYLESDVLLRDEWLRPAASVEALRQELERRLGTTLEGPGGGAGERLAQFVRTRRLDTWHTGWGLPRPSLVALQAGSCVQFRVAGKLDQARLAAVQAEGIGERRAEGYGCISFNDPLLLQTNVQPMENPGQDTPSAEQGSHLTSDNPAYEFARTLEREFWRQEIYRAALGRAADADFRSRHLKWSSTSRGGKPPMSQLGALREQLTGLNKPQDRERVLDWLRHLQDNPRRRDRWPEGSLQAIEELLKDASQVWEKLQLETLATLTADGEHALREELWPLAVRALFDACIRAHKRKLEETGSTEKMGADHGT